MDEQKAIAEAAPPPPPSETADVAAAALDNPGGGTPAKRKGYGRRKLRTDIAGGSGGLSIPG